MKHDDERLPHVYPKRGVGYNQFGKLVPKAVVSPCPFCGGQHEHPWETGSRAAQCNVRRPKGYWLICNVIEGVSVG